MRTIKGPALFLAQFVRDVPPHHTLENMARWAEGYGYRGIEIPTWDRRLFDLGTAAQSETYCDEIKGSTLVAPPFDGLGGAGEYRGSSPARWISAMRPLLDVLGLLRARARCP